MASPSAPVSPDRSRYAASLPIACGALTLGLAALFPEWTNDLFGHMAAGRQILELGRVPHHDTFSFYFDRPQPWRNHNWASGVAFYALYVAGGANLLVLFKVALCALLGGVIVAMCRETPRRAWLAALVLLWAVPSVRSRFVVRPHLFGLVFCAVLLYALSALSKLSDATRVRRVILALAAMQVVWVNLHGSAPLAFLLTLSFLVGHHGERALQKRYALVLLAQVAASCVTPFGPTLMLETANHVSSEGTRAFIAEWMPLVDSENPWDVPVCSAMLALVLWGGLRALRASRVSAEQRSLLLATIGMFVMAYRSLRFVAEPLLLGAPCIAACADALLSSRLERARAVRLGLAGLAAIGVVMVALVVPHVAPFQPVGLGMSPRNLPVEPGRWLAAHRPRARSVCVMEDCWYLSFAVPDGRVIIDGRQAVYPLDVLESVTHALTSTEGLLALLAKKPADAVVLRHTHPHHAKTIAGLYGRDDYRVAAVGDRHVLFVHGLAERDAITTLWPNLALRTFSAEEAPHAWRELARIGKHPGSAEYVGFQQAMLRAAPELRSAGYDGLAPAASDEARARHARALADLAPALVPNENQPTAQVLATMLALSLCRLDDAERSLELARSEGENRQTIALGIELAILRGQLEEARATLRQLDASTSDVWLTALLRQVVEPHARCSGR